MIFPIVGLAAAAGFALLLALPTNSTQRISQPNAGPKDQSATPPTDLEALARCMASEDADPTILVALAWVCIQVAKRRKSSLLTLLTSGLGWGPQKIAVNGRFIIRFASTDKPPTDLTMLLAAAVLGGTVVPSNVFRAAAPTSFVERAHASRRIGADGRPLQPETGEDRLLALQHEFGGLVGRIGRWYFYRLGAPAVDSTLALPYLG